MSNKIKLTILGEDEFSGVFNKLKNSLPSLKTLFMATGAAVAGAGAALYAMTKSAAESHDKVQKLSDQLGITTDFLSQMGVAAEFSGVSAASFNKHIAKMQVGLGEAASGLGTSKDAYEALGLSITKANGEVKTSEEMLPELADALKGVTSATERAELAYKIFGQRGTEMLQMFKDGSQGLKDMADEADKFGVTISGKAGANAAEFNDSLYRMNLAFTGLKNELSESLMPQLTKLQNWFADFIVENKDAIASFANTFLTSVGWMTEKGAYGIAILIDSYRGLQMIYETLTIAFNKYVTFVLKGLDWMIEKNIKVQEFLNVAGIFDDSIEAAQNFTAANKEGIKGLEEAGQAARDNLDSLINEESAFSKVGAIKESIVSALNEIREAGNIEPTGIYPYTDGNLEKTQENIERQKEAALEEAERQKEAALKLAEELREIEQENLEILDEMHDEHFLTDREKLEEWYMEQQELYANNDAALLKLQDIYLKKKQTVDDKAMKDEKNKADKFRADDLAAEQMYLSQVNEFANMFGEEGKKIAKKFSLVHAYLSTYEGTANALKDVPFPGNLVAAATVLATGMVQIQRIQGIAHGGLEYVPQEQTYLLTEGERVLSPNQNKDLTEFMSSDEGGKSYGETNINEINISVLENATNADAMLSMDEKDWEDICSDKIIPAMQILSAQGVTI